MVPEVPLADIQQDGKCAYCFVFAFDNSSLGVLVRSPMVKFKKALETLQLHDIAQYHRDASVKAVALIDVMEGKQVSIANSLNETYSVQVQQINTYINLDEAVTKFAQKRSKKLQLI